MKHLWGVYDFVEGFLLTSTFVSRREARDFCYGDKNTKVVKLVMQPENGEKKAEPEYFSFGGWFYKIEGGIVSFLSKSSKTWVSTTYPPVKQLRKYGFRINADKIK